jgi:DNA-binding protein H-NS
MPTLEQIQEKMKKLQAQADTLIAKKAQAAVDQIRKIMLTHGLTTVDIEVKAKAKREARTANGSTPNVKVKVARSLNGGTPPKYQNLKTGATWTGHGRAPAWIAHTKDRTKFLIASGTDAVRAVSVSPVNKTKTASKKTSVAVGAPNSKAQRKGPQPAKYLDPKSGATWSGRGPAPAWLAAAKDRTRFLVDGVGSANADSVKLPGKKTTANKVATKAVATKPAPKKAATAKTVGKKVALNATQKPLGKKAPTKKTSSKSTAVSSPSAVVETSVGSTT